MREGVTELSGWTGESKFCRITSMDGDRVAARRGSEASKLRVIAFKAEGGQLRRFEAME